MLLHLVNTLALLQEWFTAFFRKLISLAMNFGEFPDLGEVMCEFKESKLKTSAEKKVTDRDQAIAIGISEAKDSGSKVPEQKEGDSSKKSKKENN